MSIAPFLESVVDFPFISGNELHDGKILTQLGYCRRCETKDCLKFIGLPFKHYLCSKGFSCYPTHYEQTQFVLNGMVVVEHNHSFVGDRRKQYKVNTLSETSINRWQVAFQALSRSIELMRNEAAKDSLAYLHDIRTSVGVVLSCVQELIDQTPGASFESKLEEAGIETKNLFHAINVLENQLELADIIAAPATITYGQQYLSSMHGFLLKMVKIFRPRAAKRNIKIDLRGSSYSQVLAYNSLQFIPLILLDNAIKYSFTNRTIYVYVEEADGCVKVTFSSYGYVVPDDERGRIFEKYYRTDAAKRQVSIGMGIGLYLAKLIAEAHGSTILYSGHADDERGIGNNEFSFSLKSA